MHGVVSTTSCWFDVELLRSNSWCDTSTGVTSTTLEPSGTASFAQGAFSRSVRRACAGCRSRYPAGPDGQPTSSRLGLGLTAPAPDHQPRGHLHPQDRRRLDFDHADKLLVLFFPHVFYVAAGASAYAALLACLPARAHCRAPASQVRSGTSSCWSFRYPPVGRRRVAATWPRPDGPMGVSRVTQREVCVSVSIFLSSRFFPERVVSG